MTEETVVVCCESGTATRRALTTEEQAQKAADLEEQKIREDMAMQKAAAAQATLAKVADAVGVSVLELKAALKDA